MIIKKPEEYYQQFLVLPLFNYLFLYKLKSEYGHQNNPVIEQGIDLKRPSSLIDCDTRIQVEYF